MKRTIDTSPAAAAFLRTGVHAQPQNANPHADTHDVASMKQWNLARDNARVERPRRR